MTANVEYDKVKYGRLLAKAQPVAIQSEKELDRITAESRALAVKRNKSAEEEKLQDLLDDLIMKYEAEHHAIPKLSPLENLKFFMEEHDLDAKALMPEFGSRSLVYDVLRGRREISKKAASALAKRFNVSISMFIR